MCYFSNALQYPRATVDTICHALNDPKFGRIDFIVGTGMSETLILVPVSIQSGIPCGAVRKSIDLDGGSHSYTTIETFIPKGHRVCRYIIIDDLIKSGETIRRVRNTMTVQYDHCKCVGIILYQNYSNVQDIEKWQGIPLTKLSEDIVELDMLQN